MSNEVLQLAICFERATNERASRKLSATVHWQLPTLLRVTIVSQLLLYLLFALLFCWLTGVLVFCIVYSLVCEFYDNQRMRGYCLNQSSNYVPTDADVVTTSSFCYGILLYARSGYPLEGTLCRVLSKVSAESRGANLRGISMF